MRMGSGSAPTPLEIRDPRSPLSLAMLAAMRWLLPLWGWFDLEQTIGRHHSIVSGPRSEVFVHWAELDQRTHRNRILEAWSALTWTDDDNRGRTGWRLLWRNGQCALAYGGIRRNRDPIGKAGARRRVAVVVEDAEFAGLGIEPANRVEADLDSERDKGSEPAVQRVPSGVGADRR